MTPTLGDLCRDPELALTALVMDEERRSRPLAGAHVVEIAEPARWLAPDWLLLTTGMRLRGDAHAQRELVRHCQDNRLAAVAFGVGTVFAEPPRALVSECERRGFPLLVVPHATPFRSVVSVVDRALLSGDHRALRRRAGIQEALTDALLQPQPESTLIRRLADDLGAEVALLPSSGPVRAAGGDAPWEAIRRAVLDRAVIKDPWAVPGWVVYAEAVGPAASPSGWLAVAFDERSSGGGIGLARPVLRSAARLLSILALSLRAARISERAGHADLVDQLVDTRSAGAVSRDELTVLGFAPSAGIRVAVAVPGPPAPDLQAVAAEVERSSEGERRACLASGRRGRLALVFEGPVEQVAGWLDDALAPGGYTAGVGRAVSETVDAPTSARDAEVALRFLATGRASVRVLQFEDLRLTDWVTTMVDAESAGRKAEHLLRGLAGRPELLETLRAYLDNDLRLGSTAALLHLHPNSLRHRLNRIARLTGCDPRTVAGVMDLQLALLLDRDQR